MGRLFSWHHNNNNNNNSGSSKSPKDSSTHHTATTRVVRQHQQVPSTTTKGTLTTTAASSSSVTVAATTTATTPSFPPASPIRPRSVSLDEQYQQDRQEMPEIDTFYNNKDTTTTSTSFPNPSSFTSSSTATPSRSFAPRRRLNSRDYPRSYSGQYSQGDDLLPLELNRRCGGWKNTRSSVWTILGWYVTLVLVVHLVVVAALSGVVVVTTSSSSSSSSSSSPLSSTTTTSTAATTTTTTTASTTAWTWTALVHGLCTLLYLHWIKGSLYDDAGEMNALTVWEQWEAAGADSRPIREACMVIPCLLCWIACHTADYEPRVSAVNVAIWTLICLVPKLPFMNGVRLFGINRTAGIDDGDDNNDESNNNNSNNKKQR